MENQSPIPPSPQEPKKFKISRVIIAFIALIFYLNAIAAPLAQGQPVALVVSQSMAGLLILGAVIWGFATSWKKRSLITTLIVIGAVWLGIGKGISLQRHDQSTHDGERLKQDMLTAVQTGDATQLNTIHGSGNAGRVEAVAKQMVLKALEMTQQYQKELADAGIEEILSPTRISKDAGLKESFRQLDAMDRAFVNYQGKLKEFHDKGVYELIDKSNLPEKLKKDMRHGAKREAQNDVTPRLLKLEQAVLDNVRGILTLLKETEGKWTVKDDDFQFDDNAVLEKYRRFWEQIDKAAELQEALRQQQIDKVSKTKL